MERTISEVLEEIIYEYNLGYEPFHQKAVERAIKIIKENNLDEKYKDI